jgi:hypothetical protein
MTSKVRIATSIVVLATASLAGTVVPASAGSNGQHVQVCANTGSWYAISMWGTDQNGNFAETPRTVPQQGQHGCVAFSNYWFKGNVTIRLWRRGSGNLYDERHPYIPISQSSDWFYLNY